MSRARSWRWAVVIVGLSGLLLTLLSPASPAPAASAAFSPSDPSDPSVSLLGQTPWINGKGIFQLHIGVAGAETGDQVVVSIYYQVTTRTAFEQDATGNIDAYVFYPSPAVSLSALPGDPSGGYDLDLPVQEQVSGSLFPEVSISDSFGVFPVQVQLLGPGGNQIATPLTTFLTFSQGSARAQGYSPLSAAVIVPFSTGIGVTAQGRIAAPSAKESGRLAALATALNADDNVHASLLVSPATLAALSVGATTSTADRTALDDIGGAPSGSLMEVLPTPWSPDRLGDLDQARLGSEIGAQLDGATELLGSDLRASPSPTTWAVNGPVDTSDLEEMTAQGATQLIVPDGDLTAAPSTDTTFAHASALASPAGLVSVYSVDPGLAADFTRHTSAVEAANILLADLAMIFSEAPSETRGVVVMPPSNWTVDPTFISTLLSGLAGDPLVAATTASGLFSAAGTEDGTRSLSDPYPAASDQENALADDRGGITNARTELEELAALLPSRSTEIAEADQQLLLAESETISAGQRAAILRAIGQTAAVSDRAVSLPPATSITLTSTKGQIPITILAAADLHPVVELRLTSPRLIFLNFRPAEGTCSVPTPTVEYCLLTLKTQNTTLKVPVETRTSGVFSVSVALLAPGQPSALKNQHGAPEIDDDTVRSTAVSSVAIVLIVLALLGLAFWWVRDIRRGRRPRGMLPSPGAEPVPVEAPAPNYGADPMSPTGAEARE